MGGVAEIISEDDFSRRRRLDAGDFIGDISFFTESPQVDSVASLTVCKTLTMSQASYKLLAQDHPGSVGKMEEMQLGLPKRLEILRAGSIFDVESGEVTAADTEYYESIDNAHGEFGTISNNKDNDDHDDDDNDTHSKRKKVHDQRQALTMVKDLVKMHMDKQMDDQTTRLLFAASRGDTGTIAVMCDQGFNPNNADYDNRTALMVAAMKGNKEVVQRLLDYKVSSSVAFLHQRHPHYY